MSLCKPHPLWTTCDSSIYEANKACIQAKYLSGRYRTDKLLSHFSKENSGFCELHPEDPVVGDLLHHLVLCPALQERRKVLFEYWSSITASSPPCREIITAIMSSPIQKFMQFILDCIMSSKRSSRPHRSMELSSSTSSLKRLGLTVIPCIESE